MFDLYRFCIGGGGGGFPSFLSFFLNFLPYFFFLSLAEISPPPGCSESLARTKGIPNENQQKKSNCPRNFEHRKILQSWT